MWFKLTNLVDNLINGISMYRLLMYYLIALIIIAIGFSAIGVMNYNPVYIAISAAVLVFACWIIKATSGVV